jgi:glycosyltransferase involved in cell wall biosynthesis
VKVLYLTGKTPLPSNSGDAIRNVALLRAVRDVSDHLHLLTLPQRDGQHVQSGLAEIRALCDQVTVCGHAPSHYLGAPRNRLLTLAGRPYYHSVGSDPEVRGAVRTALTAANYDVVVLSQLFLASALRHEVLPPVVYDTHNVHHLRLEESLRTKLRLAPPLRHLVVRRVREHESSVLRASAATVACSEPDARAFREMAPGARVEVVPNGVELDAAAPSRTTARGSHLLFLASLDYVANVESLAYLVDEVLPRLRPDIEVHVAGSNATSSALELIARAGPRVRYLGYVPDARATMREAAALVVPLRTGGGTRLKVLEAFAVGLPVVGTSKAVEGIPVVPGRHAHVVDDPAGLAAAAHSVLDDRPRAEEMATAARELVAGTFEWTSLATRFAGIVADAAHHRRSWRSSAI